MHNLLIFFSLFLFQVSVLTQEIDSSGFSFVIYINRKPKPHPYYIKVASGADGEEYRTRISNYCRDRREKKEEKKKTTKKIMM